MTPTRLLQALVITNPGVGVSVDNLETVTLSDVRWPEGAVPPTQAQVDAALAQIDTAAAAQDADVSAAKQYVKLAALKAMTPAQVGSWIDANINSLADAKDALKTLAIAVSVLTRRL
jgi:hypothetical protein